MSSEIYIQSSKTFIVFSLSFKYQNEYGEKYQLFSQRRVSFILSLLPQHHCYRVGSWEGVGRGGKAVRLSEDRLKWATNKLNDLPFLFHFYLSVLRPVLQKNVRISNLDPDSGLSGGSPLSSHPLPVPPTSIQLQKTARGQRKAGKDSKC